MRGPRGFTFLWISQLFSQLADRLLLYVLLLFAYQITRSNLGASIPFIAFGIPSVILGPLAGVFVDRWNKKLVMAISHLSRAGLILAILPFINQNLLFIFLISIIIFSISQFFSPAELSSIPSVVEKKDLMAANSIFITTFIAVSIVGFGIAAPLANFFGIVRVLIIAAILYLIAAFVIFFISIKHYVKSVKINLGNIAKELLVGFEFIRRKPLLGYNLAKLFMATSVLASISLFAVEFSENYLKIGAANFGYLIFAAGIGMSAGSLFLGRFSQRFKKRAVITTGFLFAGGALILLSGSANIWLVLALVFILGLGNAFVTVPIQTLLHEKVPRQIRGRVFGLQSMFINSAFTFPTVILGGAADLIGLRMIIVILGVLVLVGGVLDLYVFKFKSQL